MGNGHDFLISFQYRDKHLTIYWRLENRSFRYTRSRGKIKINSEPNPEHDEFLYEVEEAFDKVSKIYKDYLTHKTKR